jgi:hypothetical protein
MRLRLLLAGLAAMIVMPTVSHAGNDRIVGRPLGEDVQVTAVGRIESVRGDGSFVLVANRNLTFTVTYRPDRIGTIFDRRPDNRRPRVGDRVRVVGELIDNNRIVAEDLDFVAGGGLRPGSLVTGTIRSINSDQRRMSISTPEGLTRIIWDEDTDFVRNRVRGGIQGFRVGDSVRISGRRQRDGDFLARRIVIGGAGGFETNSVGEIVSLNARTERAEIDFDGVLEEVDLRNATIRRRGGARADIEDLRLGYDVRVQGTRPVARGPIVATSVEIIRQFDNDRVDGDGGRDLRTFEGTVENVANSQASFRIRTGNGDTIRVEVGPNTRIVRGANEVGITALRRDTRVRVRARVTDEAEEGRTQVVEGLRVEIL